MVTISDCACLEPLSSMVRFFSLILITLLVVAGCDTPVEHFGANEVYSLTLARSRSLVTDEASVDAAKVVEELFGTPDEPRWPSDLFDDNDLAALVDPNQLARSAGPASSGEDGTHQGLYREHCVVCHGLSGSGTGPASLYQNPHPRDFRSGVFKWKSTKRNAKPTHGDLVAILKRGIPGTAMPTFAVLDSEVNQRTGRDLDALVDYVVYLSVRGEVERQLMTAAVDDLGYGEIPIDRDLRLAASGETTAAELVREVVSDVARDWMDAGSELVEVPAWEPLGGQPLADSIHRGREIFHGQIANCVACHGPGGNGQATTLDYDDWTKEYSTRIGLTPSDREAMRPFRKAGALRPRPSQPRNLTQGVYRGGGDAATLYRRITQGIAGTPMPAVEIVAEQNGKGLTPNQVWDLVRYVQSLEPH